MEGKYIYAIYAKEDESLIISLINDLRIQLRCDVKSSFYEDMENVEKYSYPQIDGAEVILVGLSSNVRKSENVKECIRYSQSLNKTILPVILSGSSFSSGGNFAFRSRIYNLKEKEDRDEFYRMLKGVFSVTLDVGDSYGVLVNFVSDVDAKVFKDERFLCDLKKNIVSSIRMDEGDHLFTFQDIQDSRINVKRNYSVRIGKSPEEREKGLAFNVNLKTVFDEDRKIYKKRDMEIQQTKEIRNKIVTRADRMKYYIAAAVMVLGFIIYFAWYLPYKRDKEADRMYVYATSLFLRSEKLAGVEYNQIGKLPYGSELIVYSVEDEWATVKCNGEEGYVSSKYIIDRADFDRLSGIWGDSESQNTITSSKCRCALMEYCKSAEGRFHLQVFSRGVKTKPNYMSYPRVYNKLSKFTDFFCVLKDVNSSSQFLIVYSFDDETEEPIFRNAISVAGSGLIESVDIDKDDSNHIVITMADQLTYSIYKE